MRYFITGCGGFIGSNVTDRLLKGGHEVIGYDNFSTGQLRFLEQAGQSRLFTLFKGDVLDLEALTAAMRGADIVFHFAANADVRYGIEHPRKDLEQNTIGTFHVLEAMRQNGVRRIAFSSTGSIYGEPDVFPTPEDAPFPIQTSLYGASKLAGEGLIEAYCHGFDFQSYIFRFVSILGERYTHGHIFDFYKALKTNAHELHVLGDGTQRKSYLHVQDCIDAMLLAVSRAGEQINRFNLGTDEYCEVRDSIRWITEQLGLAPRIIYGDGNRGWVGDSPFIFLDCRKMRALGWQPANSIQQGVLKTLEWLCTNQWVLDQRR